MVSAWLSTAADRKQESGLPAGGLGSATEVGLGRTPSDATGFLRLPGQGDSREESPMTRETIQEGKTSPLKS